MQQRTSAHRAALCAVLALGVLSANSTTRAQVAAPDELDAATSLDAGITSNDAAAFDRDGSASEVQVVPIAVAVPDGPALAPEQPVEVTVVGRSAAQRTRESSQAVTVVALDAAKRQSADLGEVLARVQGINVRRPGGLGSNARFFLNGLTDDQLRFTLDEVPLELSGYSQGIGNIPMFMLDRVVVYRGVVPIRYGIDALGGLVNLVSPFPTRGYGGGASFQAGSFGTYRATLHGYHVHRPTGLFTRLTLYADSSRNDYENDVRVPDPITGQFVDDRVRRFHDGYRAVGGSAEVGVVKRPWAEKLILRAFGMRFDKELQHGLVAASDPYGEARYDRGSYGATLRYQQPLGERARIDLTTAYSFQPIHFDDTSPWVYDWYGRRGRPRSTGETEAKPVDETYRQHMSLTRLVLSYRPWAGHELELAITPSFAARSGENHLAVEGLIDPAANRYRIWTLVSGVSWETNLLDDRVENTLFAKSYLYRARADETSPSGIDTTEHRDLHRFGGGDALRVRIVKSLYTKASYEYAIRMPRADEQFGEPWRGIDPSAGLMPERSHNGNLELTLDHDAARAGRYRASANGFIRGTHDQILLFPGQTQWRYVHVNVYSSRSRGVEGSVGWTSPGGYVDFDGNMTYVDLRNTSDTGAFQRYEGQRIPNRPYLLANTSARGTLRDLSRLSDELSLTWYMRYVHDFFVSWEGAGLVETKAKVPSQWTHALVLGYLVRFGKVELGGTLEAQNLTDARAYDYFGVERPGRAFYFKLTLER